MQSWGGGTGVGEDGENIVNDNVFNGQICGDCMVDGSNAMGGGCYRYCRGC